jgi:hypothetical protein
VRPDQTVSERVRRGTIAHEGRREAGVEGVAGVEQSDATANNERDSREG